MLHAAPGAHVLGALASALTARPCLATAAAPALNMRELEVQRLHGRMHLAVSSAPAALQARATGLPHDRIHVVPPAADAGGGPQDGPRLQRRLGLPDDAR